MGKKTRTHDDINTASLFSVKTQFIFDGHFFVKAENKTQAKEYVEQHCGLVSGGEIHSTLPGDVVDWEFSLHPEKVVRRVSLQKEREPA